MSASLGDGSVRAASPGNRAQDRAGNRATAPTGPHGGDAIAVARSRGIDPTQLLDLSASLNPYAPPIDRFVDRVNLGTYPDDTAATAALSAAIGIDPERLVLTNGGAEAIALVAALEPVGDVQSPEFALYERHLAEVRPGSPRWRSNPSNPLGELAPAAAVARVWDEAFWPLATGTWTRGDGSWRIGSLTKLWACPGARIGYAIAPDTATAQRLRDRRPRWSVNAVALMLIEALLPVTDLPTWSSAIAAQRQRLVQVLAERGLAVRNTAANWVLVEAFDLRAKLIEHDVLVRDCASFGMHGTYRIAVPDDGGLQRLVAALDAVVEPVDHGAAGDHDSVGPPDAPAVTDTTERRR
ncbi:MAG: aminotransferase class I/II-fold pyridoxal phosphate-dependent enzyme [Actinomycetota bacterium]